MLELFAKYLKHAGHGITFDSLRPHQTGLDHVGPRGIGLEPRLGRHRNKADTTK